MRIPDPADRGDQRAAARRRLQGADDDPGGAGRVGRVGRLRS
ncbi:hypothetical protein OHB14_40540 [Streptomyces sp. NBC_01613]